MLYFNNMTPPFEFMEVQNTILVDMEYKLESLLNHNDNQRVIKIDYCSRMINVVKKIWFNKFELKAGEDVRTMWSTFHRCKNNRYINVDVILKRSTMVFYKWWNVPTESMIMRCYFRFMSRYVMFMSTNVIFSSH